MTRTTEDQDFVTRLNAVIESNFHRDDFGVQELAKKLCISRSQLHRKITETTHRAASTYLNEYRLEKALILLQQGRLSASEVAYKVGFSSPSYFSTAFKKHFSYSPTQVKWQDYSTSGNEQMLDQKLKVQSQIKDTITRPGKLWNLQKTTLLFFISFTGLAIVSFIFWKDFSSKSTQSNRTYIADKSIAVLPFRNYSQDPSLEVFCDGMTDELISRLSQLGNFDRVISRTSAYKFKDMKLSIPEIASELGVAFILEGSMQKADGKIRVNAQLIDANRDDHVWTDHYIGDWESQDIFRIQEQITSFVTDAMQIIISKSESALIAQNVTPNKQAYDLYLQAKYQMYGSDKESMENARQMLVECIELDPSFARAYSDLGYIWFISGLSEGIRNQDVAWEKGKYYLNQAQHLDPSLLKNEFHLLQGYFYFDWDFKRLEGFFQDRFIQYTYDRESCGLIDYAIKTGRFESALAVVNQSIDADPLDASLISFKARILWFLGREEEAVLILDKLDRLNKNDWFYLREAAHTYFLMKEHEHSRRVLNLILQRFEDRSPLLLWLQLFYANMDGEGEIAETQLAELQKAFLEGASGSPAWFIGLYHLAVRNDPDQAFAWFEKSFAMREVELTWFKQEPLLDPIKEDERYLSLYRRIGFEQLTTN